MSTPEELARINIDKQLTACGWTVQSRAEMNLYAGRGIAVREFPLSTGKADSATAVSASELIRLEWRSGQCLLI